ncbi:hypothetical protein J6590_063753 [Homalodisca vitripennis]|nr:hypothetical protein J6590_063753 [Homalodisca vitripennis]
MFDFAAMLSQDTDAEHMSRHRRQVYTANSNLLTPHIKQSRFIQLTIERVTPLGTNNLLSTVPSQRSANYFLDNS